MASEWITATIAECASDEPYSTQIGPFGDKIRSDTYVEAGAPVLRGTNVNTESRFHDDDFVFIDAKIADEEFGKFVCEADDIILCHKGTLGKIGIIPKVSKYQKYIMGNSMMKVRCNRAKLEPLYLYYWLTSQEGQSYLFSRVSQVGVPQIQRPLTTLREAKLRLPPSSEQKRIAHILGTLDDKIELNRRMNATLEAMARALFQSWFVDFDPVRAKAAGQTPAGMDPATAALFPSEFEDSALGEIPKGWRVGRLDSALVLQRGFDLPATMRTEGDFPVLAASGPSGTHNTFQVHGPGITTGRSGVLGRVFYVHGDFWPLNTSLWVKDFKAVSPPYAYQLLQTIDLKGFNSGSAVPTLNRNHVHGLPTLLPPSDIVAAFDSVASRMMAMQKARADESHTLATLRDALLPKLLSGELNVGKTVAEVT